MKKIYHILTLLLCVYLQSANAQMGVNSTGAVPNSAAMLDVRSTDKGFLMPRLTTTQRNAMPAIADGLMIYNTTINELQIFRSIAGWQTASRMGVPFTVSGSDPTAGIIQGANTGAGFGVRGDATSGSGVFGFSLSGNGVYGIGTQGLYGQGTATGVYGIGTEGVFGQGTATGVYGTTSTGTGVYGQSNTQRGVWGRGITTGDGVYGDATTGNGVRGEATTGSGVRGESSSSGTGGYFRSVSGSAIDASTGNFFAIRADNNSASTATGSFFNIALGPAVKVFGGANALEITGGIKVSGGGTNRAAFKIVSVAGNIFLNQLIIPNTMLANDITDIVMITHNYGAGATNNFVKPCGVYWEPGTSTWRIYVEDSSAMPVGITFNILVIKQ